jgi:sugar lactone lactonase YvrE
MAFAPDGTLYVLEISANGLLSGDPTGALVKVGRDGSKSTILTQPLLMPGGLTVGPDGALYLTNKSTSAGAGEVLRIRP